MEYKRLVHQANTARLRSLATQMSYRLDQGHGNCIYRLGVEDDGCHSLLDYESIAESSRILECIARTLNAVVLERKMIQNEVVIDVEENRVLSHEEPIVVIEPSLLGDSMGVTISDVARLENEADDAIRLRKGEAFTRAELRIQRIETHLLDPSPRSVLELADSSASLKSSAAALPNGQEGSSEDGKVAGETEKGSIGETLSARNIRIAVVGNVDAGKSTLIGTLTTSSLDDGRGRSRTSIMKHRHEIESGRTSTASTHLMGFRSTGEPIAGKDQVRAKRKTEDEVARESYRVITLMDLAGHEKYLKTTYVKMLLDTVSCMYDSSECRSNSLVVVYFRLKYPRGVVWFRRPLPHSRQQ
jgi:GTPase